jgi:hypothetical protein
VIRSATHASSPALSSSADTVFADATNDTVHLIATLDTPSTAGILVIVIAAGDSAQLIVDNLPLPDSALAPLGTWIQWSSSDGESVHVSTNGRVTPQSDASITAELKPLVPGGYPTCDPTFDTSCPDNPFDPVIRTVVTIHAP